MTLRAVTVLAAFAPGLRGHITGVTAVTRVVLLQLLRVVVVVILDKRFDELAQFPAQIRIVGLKQLAKFVGGIFVAARRGCGEIRDVVDYSVVLFIEVHNCLCHDLEATPSLDCGVSRIPPAFVLRRIKCPTVVVVEIVFVPLVFVAVVVHDSLSIFDQRGERICGKDPPSQPSHTF
jgi:hypothetical protein